MDLKKRASRSIAIALVGITVVTPIFNSVSAMENLSNNSQELNTDDLENLTDIELEELFHYELTEEDLILIEKLENENTKEIELKLDNLSTEEKLDGLGLTENEKNQFIADIGLIKEEVASTPGKERGKIQVAVKILRKSYSKLPKPVKALLSIAGFSRLLSIVNTFTGSVESALYRGCKALGMNNSDAWLVTKTLVAIVL